MTTKIEHLKNRFSEYRAYFHAQGLTEPEAFDAARYAADIYRKAARRCGGASPELTLTTLDTIAALHGDMRARERHMCVARGVHAKHRHSESDWLTALANCNACGAPTALKLAVATGDAQC